MDYQATLKVVKTQFPELSYKEQQAKAKEMYAKFKSALTLDAEVGSDAIAATPVLKDRSILIDLEKRIRESVVDINNIIHNGLEVLPGGKIVKHGMSGVNTLVTFEDDLGNRLPVEGFFVIWI